MKDGDTEKPSNTEIQSNGETQETKETEDVPRLAASVSTLQDAVQMSVADGINENSLFIFARALKAFEITQDRRLQAAEMESAFSLWWATARPQLPEDADFDEYRLDFLDKFSKTKAPLGSNSLEQAIQRADASPPPEQAARYSSPKIKRLVAVCFHLQVLQGMSPFFLSVRAAAKITKARGLMQASAWLNGLVRDGVLLEVEKGTRKRATRFRFNAAQFMPPEHIDSVKPEKERAAHSPVSVNKSSTALAKPVGAAESTKPSQWELVERKKAIREEMKKLGHPSERTREEAAKFKSLEAKQSSINNELINWGE